ncbi:uncharacterized protein N7506_011861 [Penicillium brevicompactum]|uniref:uncharacterized protein n=1 Tax=Penicillium brevicompactum TaxID=5074 RepID=UPI002541A54A|nr:uncharacterized protein N7506_011861 [Penicillium brevicompactum]KAJ5319157.1 hypothetical protein N7506_011861 [Penicillium brevicompactum]
MKTAKLPDGHGSLYKEVRFSPTQSPSRRTKSVSATFPPTISGYGRTAFHDSALLNSFAMDTSYIDQSRALLQNQRVNFETERKLFAQERRLWEKERALLRSKITELEAVVKDQGKRSNKLGPDAAKLVLGASQMSHANGNGFTAQVWEGSSPNSQPTRVFFDYDSPNQAYLSPISESGMNPPSLDQALSPQGQLADPSGAPVSLPVPIEKLDSTLDGITLKSTALPPGVVARVITPPSPSPLETQISPATPGTTARPGLEHRNSLKLKLSELGPPNERLLRDAGHTPMAIIDADESQRSTKEGSPLEVPSQSEEAPLAPVATNVQPSENRESYFPELPDLPDDPALKGPLGLINDEEHDNDFLSALDQKLLDQAKNILGSSVESADPNETDPETELPNSGHNEPELKFKKSTNFGTAFGISNLG